MKKSTVEILIHVSLWSLILINLLNYTLVEEYVAEALISAIFIIAIIAIPFYFNYFFLADLIFVQKQYLKYFIVVIAVSVFTYLILYLTSSTWLLEDDGISGWVSAVTNLILIIGLSNLIKGILSWFQDQQKKSDLEKEKLQSELKFLKLQVNPHFLFNSLNNIYSLSYKKSDKAAPMIARLSRILRYMLYECQETQVPLTKEIDLLKNFTDLNLLKIGQERRIDFYTEGIENHHKIAPLILITFLENAFKHGNILFDETGWINIECRVENKQLTYRLANSVSQNSTKVVDSGIGLKNIEKQLQLTYPSKYDLKISETPKEYTVELNIELS